MEDRESGITWIDKKLRCNIIYVCRFGKGFREIVFKAKCLIILPFYVRRGEFG